MKIRAVFNVRAEKSSGDITFDASAAQAVHHASPFAPVPYSAKNMIGDLRMVLHPTLSVPLKVASKMGTEQRI